MIKIADYWIDGRPLPKSRPRFSGGCVYTPKPTKDWETAAAAQIRAESWSMRTPIADAVGVQIVCVYARPKKIPKAVDASTVLRSIWHTNQRCPRPVGADVDNLAKSCLDAISKAGVWIDDTQVYQLWSQKYYAALGEKEHVSIKIYR